MNNLEYFIKKHSSTILSIVSGIGVISTTILAVKATPKALELINDAKKDKNEDLKPIEVIKVAWKPYLPTTISGLATITCIFANNYLNSKIQTSLMSAYAVLNESYKNYISSSEELFGEKAEDIRNNVIKKQFNPYKIQDDNKQLYFDYHAMRYFECTPEDLLEAEDKLNQEFAATGHCSVNDFYRFLGIPTLPYGNRLGWSDNGNYKKEITFEHDIITLDDGLECTILMMDEPVIDYYKY